MVLNGKPRFREYLHVSLLFLPLNLFWSAMLVQGTQERVEQLFPNSQDVGLILTAVAVIPATFVPLLVGPWSDNCTHRWGRRMPFIFFGITLNAFAMCAMAVPSFAVFLCAFAACQFCTNLAAGPFHALLPDRIPKMHQGKASAWTGLCTFIGSAMGIGLAGFLFQMGHAGFPILLMIACVLLLLAMAITAWSVKEKPLSIERSIPLRRALRESFNLQLRRYPDFTWFLLSRFIINIGFFTAIAHLRWYVRDSLLGLSYVDLSDEQVGAISAETSWISLCALGGSVLVVNMAGGMADRMSKRRLMIVSLCVSAGACAMFCVVPSVAIAKWIAIVFGIGWGAFSAVSWALACNLLPKGREAKYLAIFHVAFTLPQVLGLAAGGMVFMLGSGMFGAGVGRRLVYVLCVACLGVGIALVLKVRERSMKF